MDKDDTTDPDEQLTAVITSIRADFVRQGNFITQDQIESVLDRRQLDPALIPNVLRALEDLGVVADENDGDEIDLGDDDDPELIVPSDEQILGSSSVPSSENRQTAAVGEFDSSKFLEGSEPTLLSKAEEQALGRSISLSASIRNSHDLAEIQGNPRLRLIVERGKSALEKLILSNLRLVHSIARKYFSYTDLNEVELLQEGTIGLMRAAQKYDHTLGLKFSTYATWWIRQSTTRAIADKGKVIRLPAHIYESISQYRRAFNFLSRDTGTSPSVHALSAELDWPIERVLFIRQVSSISTTSTEQYRQNGEGLTFEEMVAASEQEGPEELTTQSDLHDVVIDGLEKLKARERDIVIRRFGLQGNVPETLESVAQTYDITRERVRQIEAKALRKLAGPSYGLRDPAEVFGFREGDDNQ